MNKIKFALIALLLFNFTKAQTHFGAYKVYEDMKNPPWSFVWVNKGQIAIKESEVTVDNYLAFLQDVSKDSTISYLKTLVPSINCALFNSIITDNGFKNTDEKNPNKIAWIDEEKFMRENNFPPKEKVKGFSNDVLNPYNKPITGISYEQAIEYTKWCTNKFTADLYADENKPNKSIVFRLPSPTELEAFLQSGLENCNFKDPKLCENNLAMLKAGKNEKGCALYNCAGKDTCKENISAIKALGNELYSNYSYFPNWIGVYNLMGNAAEMTSEKGIAKGGSYLQLAKECWPDAVQKYTGPEKWLGIRLIAEVVDGFTKTPLVKTLVGAEAKQYTPKEKGDYILLRKAHDDYSVFIYKTSANTQGVNFATNTYEDLNKENEKTIKTAFDDLDKIGLENLLSLNEKDIPAKEKVKNYTIIEYKKGDKIFRFCWDTYADQYSNSPVANLNKLIRGFSFWHD